MNAITTPTPTTPDTDRDDAVTPSPVPSRELAPERPPEVANPPVERPTPPTPPGRRRPARRTRRRVVALGLGAIAVIGTGATILTFAGDDAAGPTPGPPVDQDALLRELVERGLIPPQSLLPLDDGDDGFGEDGEDGEDPRLRELVERGLTPTRSLPALFDDIDEDALLRQLVERGSIPAEALEPLIHDVDRASSVPHNLR